MPAGLNAQNGNGRSHEKLEGKMRRPATGQHDVARLHDNGFGRDAAGYERRPSGSAGPVPLVPNIQYRDERSRIQQRVACGGHASAAPVVGPDLSREVIPLNRCAIERQRSDEGRDTVPGVGARGTRISEVRLQRFAHELRLGYASIAGKAIQRTREVTRESEGRLLGHVMQCNAV